MKKERLKEIFKIIKIKDVLDILIFPFILIISILFKPFIKNIWIVAENPNEACDNGYIFFKYLRENRKDINVYYVIKKKSKDYDKVKKLGNVIIYRSLKHWIYYLNAKRIIITQKYSNPSPAIFYVLHTKRIINTPRIFLQHGVLKDDAKMFYYNRTKFRIFICGAKREYEYIKEKYGYPKENVFYTGLARFDNLDLSQKKNGLILITPTWRKYITCQKEFDEFIKNYYDLLNNNELIKLIEKNNIKIQLVMHKNMKGFKINSVECKNIKVNHNDEVDIQKLINKADLLVTDFSSIFMDVAYRKRPIIYYHFDEKSYRENKLSEGYFSYKEDGFGDIINNKNSLIDKIKYYINNDFKIEKKYEKRMDLFFERKDKNNCKRILECIEKIK